MKHQLDFDIFVQQAVTDAFHRYTIAFGEQESNLSRVAHLAADDLVKNWGPELALIFRDSIKAEMEAQLNDIKSE
jgi:hypothetical protein